MSEHEHKPGNGSEPLSNRRGFLRKVAVFLVGSQLVHFRFLNLGSAVPPDQDASGCGRPEDKVQDHCNPTPPQNDPDVCVNTALVQEPDSCKPGPNHQDEDKCNSFVAGSSEDDSCDPKHDDPDVCRVDVVDQTKGSHDVCGTEHHAGGKQEDAQDFCAPDVQGSDVCGHTAENPDLSGAPKCEGGVGPYSTADLCQAEPNADVCKVVNEQENDVCAPERGDRDRCGLVGGTPSVDTCSETSVPPDQDVCGPGLSGGDACMPQNLGESDECSATTDADECKTHIGDIDMP